MKKLIFVLLGVGLFAQEVGKNVTAPNQQEQAGNKMPDPPRPPTIEDLQKQISELKSQNEMANKLLQEYHQRWSKCDIQLTQELVSKRPTTPNKEK